MVIKKILFLLLLSGFALAENAYEKHCIPCHVSLPSSLQNMFMKYLAAYGGENNVKVGLRHYFRYPARDISVMPDLFIDRYGIKEPLEIDEEELREAINIYWEKYKVIGRLE
ncbi:MAG TPA: hypothetical protein ENN12_02620 [Epsilonproteobacteria bacterium]|nr:hypothetical protein [Campylobacterota bacterium]